MRNERVFLRSTTKMRQKYSYVVLYIASILIGTGSFRPSLAQQAQPAPSPTPEAIKIDFDRRVPMRDKVELSADVYRPDASGRYPVILSRTPYTKTSASALKIAKYFVSHGYVFIAMDVR